MLRFDRIVCVVLARVRQILSSAHLSISVKNIEAHINDKVCPAKGLPCVNFTMKLILKSVWAAHCAPAIAR